MAEYLQEHLSLVPIVYGLAVYLGLQVILNLINAWYVRRIQKPIALVKASFWSSVINALYFIVLSAVLHIQGLAPNSEQQPQNMLWWGLAGIPAGIVIWYLQAQARRVGMRLFGSSALVAAEDAVLRYVPHPRYLSWGLVNVGLLQPMGRELFMRGVFLPIVVFNLGWGWGIGATLIIEFLLRLNVVWAPATAVYSLAMCGLFALTGNALCGLVAAAVAGFIHGTALLQVSLRRSARERAGQVEQAALAQSADAADSTGPDKD